jgi:aryl-alcohol dehydrogenase-like predicted oxidoreductase
MKTLSLGGAGVEVSAMCLGAMRFGTATDGETSARILDAYVEAGGSFIDTANVYAVWEANGRGGDSEELLGRWMRERGNRDRLFLATKMGSRLQASGRGLRRDQIERECEASLGRLGVETVDLYYAHFDDLATPVEETMGAFDALIRAGKARHIGASNFYAWRLEQARAVCAAERWTWYCCVQQRYSYLQPVTGARFGVQVAANEDLLEYRQARGLRLLAYSPLLGGCYQRANKPVPLQYQSALNEKRLAALQAVAGQRGVSPSQLVLAWMLQQDSPVLPIIGVSSVEQLQHNLAALEIALSEEEMKRLNLQA